MIGDILYISLWLVSIPTLTFFWCLAKAQKLLGQSFEVSRSAGDLDLATQVEGPGEDLEGKMPEIQPKNTNKHIIINLG